MSPFICKKKKVKNANVLKGYETRRWNLPLGHDNNVRIVSIPAITHAYL